MAAPNLMQNCDLPPPTKLVLMSSIYQHNEDDKLEILKALHRSQTRAAEAERQLRILSDFNEALSGMLVDDSMILFAHRQCLNLLQIRVLMLERERRDSEEGSCGKKCCGAIALCLLIAFTCSCRYLL